MRGRYAKLLLHGATAGQPETPSAMDAGLVLCDALAGRPTREPAAGTGEPSRDGGGHGRAFYPGLIAYAKGLAALLGEAANLEPAPQRPDGPRLTQPAADDGAAVAAEVWDDLAALVRRREGAGTAILNLVAAQDHRAAYLRFDGNAGDNPEPWWYHELVLLHAVTSYALLTGDAAASESAKRAAAFHHAETQPDHATGQPWAVHAFLLDPDTTPTADLLLLAAGVNGAGGLSAVSRILLADAAVCLSLSKRLARTVRDADTEPRP